MKPNTEEGSTFNGLAYIMSWAFWEGRGGSPPQRLSEQHHHDDDESRKSVHKITTTEYPALSIAELEELEFDLRSSIMIHFVLLISRQGKVRLTKWYSPYTQKERTKVIRELSGLVLSRGPKLCNFVEWRGFKVAYKRYASLYFCMCIDQEDNELEILEIIHHFVEILDRYFGSVCELDLIFNFHKVGYAHSVQENTYLSSLCIALFLSICDNK
ncbi:hypothetical protein EUGRSUZ_H05014 [Eucalyptus grandis]|uniref:Uncharacterized protein n=2 Tax=Eucalyptus grandis TaxID=71139 RepID=A0ACC3K588_EUCGR|nr:hypothetical protein EUGRSUZ_H05014 [Eucalyptus grandis]